MKIAIFNIKDINARLPFVHSVAESHDGSIVNDSSPDTGTTFIIDILVDARPFLHSPTLQNKQ